MHGHDDEPIKEDATLSVVGISLRTIRYESSDIRKLMVCVEYTYRSGSLGRTALTRDTCRFLRSSACRIAKTCRFRMNLRYTPLRITLTSLLLSSCIQLKIPRETKRKSYIQVGILDIATRTTINASISINVSSIHLK